MRLSANQYAKALQSSMKDKPQSEVDLMVANFFKLLAKNRQMKLARKIIGIFQNIHNKENGIIEMRVTSRELLSPEMEEKLREYASRKYQAKEVRLENIIDEKIKGGIILQVGDELLDASVAGMLVKLKKELNK